MKACFFFVFNVHQEHTAKTVQSEPGSTLISHTPLTEGKIRLQKVSNPFGGKLAWLNMHTFLFHLIKGKSTYKILVFCLLHNEKEI